MPWKPTLWQSSGSDIVTHTHMKNRWKRREKMEKEDECVSFKRTKGEKKRKKKTYWWCEFRVNELAKFSGHNNADIQANFQLHTDLSLNTFIKKKKLQNWSKMLRLPRKIKEQSCLSCVRNERKKIQSQRRMTWSLCVHVDIFFYVFVSFSLTQPNTLKVKLN